MPSVTRAGRRVLLCSNNESLGLKVAYCLRLAGYEVDVVSIARSNTVRHSRYVARFHAIRGDDDASTAEALVRWVNTEAPTRRWDAMLCDDVHSHGFVHPLRERLAVPAFAPWPSDRLASLHDKWSFYVACRDGGVPVPRSELVDGPGVSADAAAAVGFPQLVKPLNAESGHGIHRVDDFATLARYLSTPGAYKERPLMIQRFVAGHTIGLSLLAEGGRLLAHDVQLHADDGSRLFYDDPEVVDVGRRIVELFGYGGPGHIDFIRDDATGELFALEFNCRFWFSATVSAWRGGNFAAMAVDVARGSAVPECSTLPGRYFQPGTVVGMMRSPRRLLGLDGRNWRGFWQAISDPIPHLMHRLDTAKREARRASRTGEQSAAH